MRRRTDTPAAAETDANGKTYKDGVIGSRTARDEGGSGFGGWLDGIIGGKSKSSGGRYGGSMEDGLAYEISPSSPAGKSESAYYGPAGNGTQIQAGTLTAGEHNDLA